MPLPHLISSHPDLFLNHIVHDNLSDSFNRIYLLIQLSTSAHNTLIHHPGAPQLWLRFARVATGEDLLHLDKETDFRAQIRRMIFPWETIPQTLHLQVSADRWWVVRERIVFASDDRAAEAYPSRPCAPEEATATAVAEPTAWPATLRHNVRCTFPSFNRSDHVHQTIHATAFAVLERFHPNAVERGCSGAYFFTVAEDGRARFHMHVSGPDFTGVARCRAYAGEMWIEAGEGRFLYFGPHAHPSCRRCDGAVVSRHEPVFWDVMSGAATAVPPLDLRSAIGRRAPLHFAAYSEHIDQLRRILDAGADPDVRDAFGITPLEVAVGLNWVDGIRLLVRSGAGGVGSMLHSVSRDDEDSWNTMLETVEALLALRADPNHPNACGQTPLFFARFDADIVFRLCASGADASHAEHTGATPLHFAVRRRRLGTAHQLLRCRADVNARTRGGVTPLMVALGWAEGEEFLRARGARDKGV